MANKDRKTLKNYFREGQLPSEDHFADLIDSMLNMTDEGFRKSLEHGLEVSSPIGHDDLISLYRDQDLQSPLWSLGLSSASDQLLIQQGNSPQKDKEDPLLCLDARQRVGIGNCDPQVELDVSGTLQSRGRMGSFPVEMGVPADGEWHDLIKNLEGCQAFEVMAGAGHCGEGRFALAHAIAMNTYNPTLGILEFLNRKRGIRCTHAYYGRRGDRVQFRWIGTSGKTARYRLQIRTGNDFGQDDSGTPFQIHVQVTRLWFDAKLDTVKR